MNDLFTGPDVRHNVVSACGLQGCTNPTAGRFFLRLSPLPDGTYMGRNVHLCPEHLTAARKVNRIEPEHNPAS